MLSTLNSRKLYTIPVSISTIVFSLSHSPAVKSRAAANFLYFSTSSSQPAKYISFKKGHHPFRDNTPFLGKNYYLNHLSAVNNTDLEYDMPTNKDRPKVTKAERRKRRREGGFATGCASGAVDKYSDWPREALLQRIRELEGTSTTAGSSTTTPSAVANTAESEASSNASSPSQASTPTFSTIETPKRKDRRPFDLTKYARRHVAFKVAYFGWPYAGFAAQGLSDIKTVESELFNALMAARIIDDPQNCNYSRCGRTDRGVSGLGQVIALTVRSGLPKSSPHVIRTEGDGYDPKVEEENAGLTQEELEAKEGVYYKNGIKRNKDGSVFGELAYLNIINRLLPPDIRIVAWAAVPEDFNARFNCAWREYKYFFPKGIIDIDRMKAGAVKFLGTHDFRNFCKYDSSKLIEQYDRTVHAISIDPVPEHEFPLTPNREFYQLTLRGSAFLWHQVRCMMAVLFSIGQGLEEPEVIDQMMDLKQCPAKPNYDMASDLPLVLYDCHFEGIEWHHQTEVDLISDITPLRLYRAMEDQWSCYVTKSLMYSRMLQQLDQAMLINLPEKGNKILLGEYALQNATKESNISLGGDLRMFMGKKYSNLMDRQKCLPTDVKTKRHQEKKRQKLSLSENNSAKNSDVDSPKPTEPSTLTAEETNISTSSSGTSTSTADKHIEKMDES